MALIHFDRVTVTRRGAVILSDISFTVRSGQKAGLTGPSGSGKSTVLLTLLGACPVSGGDVFFGSDRVCPETVARIRRSVAYIGQEPVLGAETVAEALRLPFTFRANRRAAPDADRITAVLAQVGLDRSLLPRRVQTVSGGEKQRLAIARALLLDKRVFLCDEITSALDDGSREAILRLFANPDFTVLSVAHDEQWLSRCDTVWTVRGGRLTNRKEADDHGNH